MQNIAELYKKPMKNRYSRLYLLCQSHVACISRPHTLPTSRMDFIMSLPFP